MFISFVYLAFVHTIKLYLYQVRPCVLTKIYSPINGYRVYSMPQTHNSPIACLESDPSILDDTPTIAPECKKVRINKKKKKLVQDMKGYTHTHK